MSELQQRQLLPKQKRAWQGYAACVSDTEAVRLFVAKFGREPAEVKRNGGGVLAGPLTKTEVG